VNIVFHYYNLLNKLKKPNISYIFCINTGRAGSQYLSELLGTADNVYSYHEPEPKMSDRFLQMVNNKEYFSTFNSRRNKSAAVLKTALSMPANSIYAETSHMFIKTFFDVLCHDLENVTVIHLRREMLATLKSFIQLNYFAEENNASSDNWMTSPNAKTSAISCLDRDTNLDQIDKCIAYFVDIEARAQRFKVTYQQIPIVETALEDLNTQEGVISLFDSCGLKFNQKTEEFVGKKINERTEKSM